MALNSTMPDFMSGVVVTEAQLDALSNALNGIQAPWDTYTPTFTGITVGNGTVVARFLRIGKTVHYRVQFVAGSTSTFTGTLAVSLPLMPSAEYQVNDGIGTGVLYDTSAGAASRTGATASLADNSGNVLFLADRVSPSTANATNPWTWATGDRISITGTYEAA